MRGQGLPVNMIVLTALALLVLVVVAAFFITGMSGAAQQTKTVEDFQAYCNGLCGQMVVAANNANTIDELNMIQIAQFYQGTGCARQFGCCMVTLRSGEQVCAEGNCDSDADCVDVTFPWDSFTPGVSITGCPDYQFTAVYSGFDVVFEQTCGVNSKCEVKNEAGVCSMYLDSEGETTASCRSRCADIGYSGNSNMYTEISPANAECICR